MRKSANVEVGADAVVVAADGAMDAERAVTGLQRRGWQPPWLRVRRSLPRHLLVRWNRGEASRSDRPRDTSRSFFQESQFPSTED